MWKSKKFIILGAVLAVVIVIVATAGVALAADPPKPGTGPGQEIMARVAQILGIDQQKLADAFKQATTEFRTAHPRPTLDQRLDQLVKDGKITQQQADQLKAWEAKKPAVDPKANQAFQDWLKSRPSIQLPGPGGTPGPGFFPRFRFPFGGPKPPPPPK